MVLVIAATLAMMVSARNYAVIVAGSNTYSNYRHQSDMAHHYQVLRQRGFEEDDIITFMYDDLAQNRQNPFPGTTFNAPADDEGINYYKGIKIDYSGRDVTPDNFLKAIVGNSTGAVGPVLKTGRTDNILISMDDHGAPGLFAFPSTELYVQDFKAALDYIVANNKAAKVAVYIEACESGSMCKNVIPSGSPVICMTASDEHQSDGVYCGSEATVNGKSSNQLVSSPLNKMLNSLQRTQTLLYNAFAFHSTSQRLLGPHKISITAHIGPSSHPPIIPSPHPSLHPSTIFYYYYHYRYDDEVVCWVEWLLFYPK